MSTDKRKRSPYVVIGDRLYEAVGDRWNDRLFKFLWTYCKAGVRILAISYPPEYVHMMDDSLCTHGLSDWDGKERRKSPLEAKLNDAKKLGLRGGSDSWGCRLCPATAPRGKALIHDEDCPWAALFDERLTDDPLSQGKAQLHLRRECRRRLNEQERRKSDRRLRGDRTT